MNSKKKKEKEIARGFMTGPERREIQVTKWEEQGRRKHGKKYKESLNLQIEKSLRKPKKKS